MNITFTKTYSNVMVMKFGDLQDVVASYYCIITGTDSDSGTVLPIGFTVNLSPPNPSNFIEFQSLTQEIFDTWTSNFGNLSYYESQVTEGINNIVNPPVIIKPLPFE
jgi:hypothetical protein